MNCACCSRIVPALLLALVLSGAAAPAPVADAAMRGDRAQVRALLARGANVNAAQGDGMSALHWAAYRGDAELADLLLKAGAKTEATTRNGAYTPLHLASKGGHALVVRRLLRANSNVKAVTSTGQVTPLHLAAGAGSVDAVS